MRILIAGAGVAGMTLAALLDRRGVRVELVERAKDFEHAGYMIGLWPLGSRVLHGLGLYDGFVERSVVCDHYEIRDGHGEPMKSFSMESITERFGPILSSTRPDLVELLRGGLGRTAIRFQTAVERVEQRGEEVVVGFSDGTEGVYDLVVGADGIHSRVRRLVFGEQPVYDTGWGGWVWWADNALIKDGSFVECWGAGRFLGMYPTKRGLGMIACAPAEDGFEDPGAGRADRIKALFAGMGATADGALAALPSDEAEMFFWRLADVRSSEWVKGRVVLLGDSAAGFLPTAGIGASMAMESAAVLADELGRTDNRGIGHALALFEKRRRHRVESIQGDSRGLAKMMFVKSSTVAAMRKVATHFYTLEMFASSIAKAFDQPI